MADKEIEDDAPIISYEADPESFKTIVLKVHKKLDNKNDPFGLAYSSDFFTGKNTAENV